MQYIKKQNTPPRGWDKWFTKATGVRSYDYKADYASLTEIEKARVFLIAEQNGLCAYCQKTISINDSSIEHVVPKEQNKELSTNYHNLVAVCKTQQKDTDTGKFHCDKAKENKPVIPLIFLSNSEATNTSNNKYFEAYADGKIVAHHNLSSEIKVQVEGFIEVLNLNHKILKETRTKDVLDGLLQAYRSIPSHQRNLFWKAQFDRIIKNKNQPYRQFLLIYIGNRIGIN